eukprot:gene9657-8281_t
MGSCGRKLQRGVAEADAAAALHAPAAGQPAHAMSEQAKHQEAQAAVGALPPELRQAAIAKAGGRQGWTRLAATERLRLAKPDMLPVDRSTAAAAAVSQAAAGVSAMGIGGGQLRW